MESVKFTRSVSIGFIKGNGYGTGIGPYDLNTVYNIGDIVKCIIRPRIGMPEYDIQKEKLRNGVDLVFIDANLVACNVDRNCFVMVIGKPAVLHLLQLSYQV